MTRWLPYALLACALACSGSKKSGTGEVKEVAIKGTPVSKSVELGPVKATVSVVPAAPSVGDKIRLVLRVEAEANVDVEMPPGTEALGRFRILNHKQDDGSLPGGKRFYEHRLTMRPGGSGKQRVPKLRVEFVDNRKLAGLDAGVAKPQELLTDELVIEVKSVEPKGGVTGSLQGPRENLKPPSYSALSWLWPYLSALAVMLIVAVVLTLLMKRKRSQTRVSAYAIAISGLSKLEQRGLPGATEADDWYVDLSGIVRHYLEDRYALRAPELTTEEFLREARRSAELSDGHRALLSKFLEQCDRVKFAGYHPDENESRDILQRARSFIEESRVVEDGAEDTVGVEPLERAPEAAA